MGVVAQIVLPKAPNATLVLVAMCRLAGKTWLNPVVHLLDMLQYGSEWEGTGSHYDFRGP